MTTAPSRYGLCTIAALLIAPSLSLASAQEQPLFHVDDVRQIGRGFLAEGAPVGRCELGNLTDDHRRDAVVAQGVKLYFAPAPGLYHTVSQVKIGSLEPAYSDFAILPGAAPSGYDAIVMTTASGLELWAWDGTNHVFTQSLVNSTDDWKSLERIRVGDLDGDATQEIVGLAPGSNQLRVIYDHNYGSHSTITVNNPGAIHDFALIKWDDGQDLELAVLTANTPALRIIEPLPPTTPSVVESFVGTSAEGDFLVPMHYPNTYRGRVAVLITNSIGDLQLFVARKPSSGAGAIDWCANLGAIPVVAGATADLDALYGPDLILSQASGSTSSTNDDLLVLKHLNINLDTTGTSYAFTSGNYIIVDTGSPATEPHAGWPASADADNDTDLDIVFPVQDDVMPFLAFMPSRLILEGNRKPAITNASSYRGDNGDLSLTLYVEDPSSPLQVYGKVLEVIVWEHDVGWTGTPSKLLPGSPVSVKYDTFLLPPTSYPWDTFDFDLLDLVTNPTSGDVITVVMREMLTSGGTITNAGPDYVGCIVHDSKLIDLAAQFNNGSTAGVFPLQFGGPGNGNILLNVLPMRQVPHFPNDTAVKDKQGSQIE